MSGSVPMRMLVKCETKSNRVKGVSFHASHSWILASLHNGLVQLWDYRLGSLLETFDEHDGPVRGISFHVTQPLFVTGGDDYKIKVWNYQFRRCIFTLLGHLDYIRTVEFHHEYPWIVSSSDDQTVRLWNWQSRACLAVLTGHNHYVMSALFHPKEDLIVSASLDQTVRVWDMSALHEKSNSGDKRGAHVDVFGSNDATVKHVLEGHDRGVNWACFHPTMPLVASVADDRTVKLWRMNDSKAWEIDTLRGHFNNVSCVIFHRTKDLVITNSEDRTIRIWDGSSRTPVHTFRRENDRFWTISQHPNKNLLAVGHDGGMVVFKLDRERPAYMASGSNLYYVKDRYVVCRAMDDTHAEDKTISSCRRAVNAMVAGIRSLEFNPYSAGSPCILVTYDQDGGGYDIFAEGQYGTSHGKQGSGSSVCFTARNRFAVLRDGQIGIANLNDELSKTFEPPVPTSSIHLGGSNRVMLRDDDKASLYDLTSRKLVGSCNTPAGTRYVIWSPNMNYVAFLGKNTLMVATKNLDVLYTVHESIRLKSGAWDEHNVFIYATASHVKYCIPSTQDSAALHSLSEPIYIFRAAKGQYYYLDRANQPHKRKIDPTEYLFKIALHQQRYADVKTYLKSARLCGNVVIGYLKQRGHPEVALHFVEDPWTRFNLALEYGHLGEALPAAQQLDDPQGWARLGREALRQGNQVMVEMVFQKTKNFDALSFLYFITGCQAKLQKMLKIAGRRNDVMSRYHNALLCGDVEERVKVLAESGQVPLAALTARTHGLTEYVTQLEESLGRPVEPLKGGTLLLPPVPLTSGDTWPVVEEAGDPFQNSLANAEVAKPSDAPIEEPGFEDAMDVLEDEQDEQVEVDLGAWGGDLDLAEADDLPAAKSPVGASRGVARGDSASAKWLKQRKLPLDLVAAGEFNEALQLLQRRIGLLNAAPLEAVFMRVYAGAWCLTPGLPNTPPISLPLRAGRDQGPYVLFSVPALQEQEKEAAKLTTIGKFADALRAYRALLQTIPLAAATSADEDGILHDLIATSEKYVSAMRLEVARKELPATDVARGLELVSYLACCKLAPSHVTLTLRVAMSTAFKAQNFLLAAYFAKRLLQGSAKPPADLAQQARKVLQLCEQKATDAHQINFDTKAAGPEGTITVCCASMAPIAASAATVQCPYCGSSYSPQFAGSLCKTCDLSKVGAQTLGLQFRPL